MYKPLALLFLNVPYEYICFNCEFLFSCNFANSHFRVITNSTLIFQVSKESAGGIDEEDFIKAFTDVPAVQVHKTKAQKRRISHSLILFNYFTVQAIKFRLRFFSPSLQCRSTHRGILRTTSTRSVRSALMTNMTGTREPLLYNIIWLFQCSIRLTFLGSILLIFAVGICFVFNTAKEDPLIVGG